MPGSDRPARAQARAWHWRRVSHGGSSGATWLELGRELFQLAINVGPFLLRALVPGHDPRHEIDPAWMRQWIDGYALLPNDQPLPLIDTRHPDMPVPFGSVKHQ